MVQQLHDSSRLIEYPETDDQPMTESDATRTYMIYCISALQAFFQSRPQIYVSGNLFIYYEEGDSKQNISPDVFVIFGVSKRERRSYKTWQENNKVPAFVLELTSKSTKKQDEETKPLLYGQLGIQEYFQYDPTGDYLNPQLKGQTLVNGEYQSIASQTLPDGSIVMASQVLGLDLKLLPATATSFRPSLIAPLTRELRIIDPSTGTQLLTYEESERSRLQAEQEIGEAQHQVEQAQQQAEEERLRAEEERLRAEEERLRAERLAAHLRSLGVDPETLT
ncbi:MAG: Uma2 family endonuclease [Cyanobacteria bacterium P01_F01_bin.150]